MVQANVHITIGESLGTTRLPLPPDEGSALMDEKVSAAARTALATPMENSLLMSRGLQLATPVENPC